MSGGSGGGVADPGGGLRRIDDLLRRRRPAEALALCDALLAREPDSVEGWMLRARALEQQADLAGMLTAIRTARTVAPGHRLARFIEVEALLHNGEVADARAALATIEAGAGSDFACWRRLADFHLQIGQHADAARCIEAALAQRPADLGALHARASIWIALGRLDEAEALLDRLIAARPQDGAAYYNRSTLRRQRPDSNHVAELRRVLAGPLDPAARVPLQFALAKELEDLGEPAAAFEALRAGADARRQMLSYRVEQDEQALAQIRTCHDARWLAGAPPGHDDPAPLLVVGLPRSGTTLVERILGCHSQVASVGEVNDLAFAVMRLGGPAPKAELIERSTRIAPAALGRAYCHALAGYGRTAARIIDKTPLNLLYLGLVAAALPRATIVHLRRHPLASIYAMYKTLFQMGYPFSYDLLDLARYYVAYHRLMAHWREVLPGRFLDLDYEALVDAPEREARRLLAHCGLDWEPQCLRFHEDARPTATASAAQVRRPLYRSSRDQWRDYAVQLAPAAQHLADAGIDVA